MFSRLFIFKAVAYYRKGLFRKGITVENLDINEDGEEGEESGREEGIEMVSNNPRNRMMKSVKTFLIFREAGVTNLRLNSGIEL